MKTKIGIEGAEFFAYHGYYEEERKAGCRFLLHAAVEMDINSSQDELNNTINYENLYTICKEEMNDTQHLLETVVHNILKRFQTEFKNATSGSVRLEKMGPQLGGKVEKTFVQMSF